MKLLHLLNKLNLDLSESIGIFDMNINSPLFVGFVGDITFYLLKYCKLLEIHDKKLKYEYNGQILFDKTMNAPEVFKLTFDNKELKNIELIEFDDIPFNHGI